VAFEPSTRTHNYQADEDDRMSSVLAERRE